MARVYDYWLGGKDNYAGRPGRGRAAAADLLAVAGSGPGEPGVRDPVGQPGRPAAESRQFIDLGAGLPTVQNTHEVVRAVNPAARVAYVDVDPVVLSHARALLAIDEGVTAVSADLCDPAAVLAHPDLRAVIDPARPAGIILGAVLHFIDADAARAVTAGTRG